MHPLVLIKIKYEIKGTKFSPFLFKKIQGGY